MDKLVSSIGYNRRLTPITGDLFDVTMVTLNVLFDDESQEYVTIKGGTRFNEQHVDAPWTAGEPTEAGLEWYPTEAAKRWAEVCMGVPASAWTFADQAQPKLMLAEAPSHGLTVRKNGDGTIPAVGDLLCYSKSWDELYGRAGIVYRVVQQGLNFVVESFCQGRGGGYMLRTVYSDRSRYYPYHKGLSTENAVKGHIVAPHNV